MNKEILQKQRFFLKTTVRKQFDMSDTDQSKGVPMPPIQKETNEMDEIIQLPNFDDFFDSLDLKTIHAIKNRETKRKFNSKYQMTLKELSYLLWSQAGVRKETKDRIYRTVPSAGNRHPIDTYLCVFNVEGLKSGIYRYLPLSHSLVLHKQEEKLKEKLNAACNKQIFVSKGSVTFIWVAVPYRTEWRYMYFAHKSILMDAGHICQNLYLACEPIKYGTCAIGAYDQELMDNLLDLDGEDEFVIYLAPVGK